MTIIHSITVLGCLLVTPIASLSYLESLNSATPSSFATTTTTATFERPSNGGSYLDALASSMPSSPSGGGMTSYLDTLPQNTAHVGGTGGAGLTSYLDALPTNTANTVGGGGGSGMTSYTDSLSGTPTAAFVNQPSTVAPMNTVTSTIDGFFQHSKSLNLAAAEVICDNAIAAVSTLAKPSPVCVTVLDRHGDMLVRKRMDGCSAGAWIQFSFTKARTCIHLSTSSRNFRMKYLSNDNNGNPASPPQFTQAASMVSIMDGELIPVAGGILVQDEGA